MQARLKTELQILTDSLKELLDINSILGTCFNYDGTYGFSIFLSILQGNFPGKEVKPRGNECSFVK
jgi:hypothetical protein